MNSCVFDASAIVAILEREPGWEIAMRRLPGGIVSTVNVSEAIHVLEGRGADHRMAVDSIRRLRLEFVPFDEEQAFQTAAFHAMTRKQGVSLGDRACLALAMIRKCPVLTGDRGWRNLDLGLQIEWFR